MDLLGCAAAGSSFSPHVICARVLVIAAKILIPLKSPKPY